VAAQSVQNYVSTDGAVVTGQESLRTVSVLDLGVLVSYILDSLVPRNSLPLVLTTQVTVGVLRGPVLSLHRILDTVSTKALLLLSLTTYTTSLLREVERVFVSIVGLLTDNDTVLNHYFVHAAAATVVPAGCGDPLATFFDIHNGGIFDAGSSSLNGSLSGLLGSLSSLDDFVATSSQR
jgi:hypothetical protein